MTFTSGAIARGFVSAIDEAGLDAGQVMSRLVVASIGPVTSDAMRDLGYAVDIEAPESTMGSLVEAVGAYFGRRCRSTRAAARRYAASGIARIPGDGPRRLVAVEVGLLEPPEVRTAIAARGAPACRR